MYNYVSPCNSIFNRCQKGIYFFKGGTMKTFDFFTFGSNLQGSFEKRECILLINPKLKRITVRPVENGIISSYYFIS